MGNQSVKFRGVVDSGEMALGVAQPIDGFREPGQVRSEESKDPAKTEKVQPVEQDDNQERWKHP